MHSDTHEVDSPPLLDLAVKYAAIMTWLIYAAGLTHIAGLLDTLHVPMDSEFFSLPRVLSYGGDTILELVLPLVVTLVVLSELDKKTSNIVRYLAWIIPVCTIVSWEHVFSPGDLLKSRLFCSMYFLIAIYVTLSLARGRSIFSSKFDKVFAGIIIFWAVIQGAGIEGEIEAHHSISSHPFVQFLLPQEDVEAASKIGFTFSSTPGLCDPVAVATFNDKNYYVWLPIKITNLSQVNSGMKVEWAQSKTVILPRERVRLIAAQH
jgi:hypothetical protein